MKLFITSHHIKSHRHRQQSSIIAARRSLANSRGDTLIEIMMTFFIISVGVLGASSMQIAALRNLDSSNNRDQAIALAENLAESIKAVDLTANPGSVDQWTRQYRTQANELLPSARLGVNRNANPTSNNLVNYTITVRWDEDRSGSTGLNCPAKTPRDLDCYQIVFSP